MHLTPSTAWAWLIACAVVILLFPLAAQFGNLKGKLSSFRTWVWAIALLGIVTAGFMPFTFDPGIANFEVQPFIFFVTGTLLGVLFLGEFHRMNAQKKLKHPQRVHAERRTRYSKAVEQLAYPNPAVRASALSTLAGRLMSGSLTSSSALRRGRRRGRSSSMPSALMCVRRSRGRSRLKLLNLIRRPLTMRVISIRIWRLFVVSRMFAAASSLR